MGTQRYATTFTAAFLSPCPNTALRSRVTNGMASPAVPEEALVDDLMEFANLNPFCGALLDDALRELGYVRDSVAAWDWTRDWRSHAQGSGGGLTQERSGETRGGASGELLCYPRAIVGLLGDRIGALLCGPSSCPLPPEQNL